MSALTGSRNAKRSVHPREIHQGEHGLQGPREGLFQAVSEEASSLRPGQRIVFLGKGEGNKAQWKDGIH